jgi:hypothetical protein
MIIVKIYYICEYSQKKKKREGKKNQQQQCYYDKNPQTTSNMYLTLNRKNLTKQTNNTRRLYNENE